MQTLDIIANQLFYTFAQKNQLREVIVMTAYKDEKTNTWYCQFWYKDWTGKNRHKVKRGFKLKRDAEQWEQAFKNEKYLFKYKA